MNSFRTIAAVLVVLLAFTCFQLIANNSLREAVRSDVKHQVGLTEDEMLRHQEQIRKATELMGKLTASLEAANSEVDAAAAKSADLTKSVGELESKVKALGVELEDVGKRLEMLKGAAENAPKADLGLMKLQEHVESVEAGAKSAADNVDQLSATLRKMTTEFGQYESAVRPSDVTGMKEDVERVRSEVQKLGDEIRKLLADLESAKPDGGGS